MLENLILHNVTHYIADEENLMGILETERTMANENENRKNEKINVLEQEQRRLKNQIKNIANAIALSGINSVTLVEKLTDLEADAVTIKQQIKELQNTDFSLATKITDEDIINIVKNIHDVLSMGNPEEIKQLLLSFVHRIEVRKDDGTLNGSIAYYIPLTCLPIDASPSGPLA